MPLPQSTGWVDYSWYPRVAFFGVVPIVDCFDDAHAQGRDVIIQF